MLWQDIISVLTNADFTGAGATLAAHEKIRLQSTLVMLTFYKAQLPMSFQFLITSLLEKGDEHSLNNLVKAFSLLPEVSEMNIAHKQKQKQHNELIKPSEQTLICSLYGIELQVCNKVTAVLSDFIQHYNEHEETECRQILALFLFKLEKLSKSQVSLLVHGNTLYQTLINLSALINIWQYEKHSDTRLFDELSVCIQEQICVLTKADQELNKQSVSWWFPLVIGKSQQTLIFDDNPQDLNLNHRDEIPNIQYPQSVGVDHMIKKLPSGKVITANQTIAQQVPDVLRSDKDAELPESTLEKTSEKTLENTSEKTTENTSESIISEDKSILAQPSPSPSPLNLAEIILNQEDSEYVEQNLRPLAAYNQEISLSLENLAHIKRKSSKAFNLEKLKVLTSEIKTRINDFTLLQIEQNQEIISQDGGLLLLWPYLNVFFNKFSLLHTNKEGEQEFVNEYSQLKAHALLVNLLAQPVSEKVYAVANLLTGLEPDTLVETEIALEQVDKDACEQLLHAVINNWKALKVMPIASFREMYLRREIKCSTSELGYTLAVENKAQDILITKLPWGVGTITLPWLGKQLLQVEWRYGY